MKKQIVSSTVNSAELVDLGVVLGQNQAFTLIAGRCTAAQAASLHRLREDKKYTQVTTQWSEFCTRYLKMSRSQADHLIRLYEEFGPAYFEISQVMRISPETFRAIAPSIQNGALHWDGDAIELTAENSRRIGEAVAQIRRQAEPKKTAGPTGAEQRTAALDRRCADFLAELQEISRDGRGCENRWIFESVLQRIQLSVSRLLLENGIRT